MATVRCPRCRCEVDSVMRERTVIDRAEVIPVDVQKRELIHTITRGIRAVLRPFMVRLVDHRVLRTIYRCPKCGGIVSNTADGVLKKVVKHEY